MAINVAIHTHGQVGDVKMKPLLFAGWRERDVPMVKFFDETLTLYLHNRAAANQLLDAAIAAVAFFDEIQQKGQQ